MNLMGDLEATGQEVGERRRLGDSAWQSVKQEKPTVRQRQDPSCFVSRLTLYLSTKDYYLRMQAEEGNDHIGDFYHCYDKIPNKKKLKGGWGVLLAYSSKGDSPTWWGNYDILPPIDHIAAVVRKEIEMLILTSLSPFPVVIFCLRYNK